MLVAEVGLRGTGGDDEAVIIQNLILATEVSGYGVVFQANVAHFALDHADVVLIRQDLADGWGDFTFGKDASCYLVQQWLEEVVVGAVYDGDCNIRVLKFLGGEKATEARSNDDDMVAVTLGAIWGLRHAE